MDEWATLAKGGGAAGVLWLAIKLIWPILSKQSEASANRLETDSTLHQLYQDTLKAQREISQELSAARDEIGALRLQVVTLTHELTEARNLLAKAEESLAAQANRSASLEVK